jgi:hypothetical protein
MRCRDAVGPTGYLDQFWQEIHQKLLYLHGATSLSPAGRRSQYFPADDVVAFLSACPDEEFLDFIEIFFQINSTFQSDRDSVIADLNSFFQVDDLPYSLTSFVWTKGISRQFGREYESTLLSAYPQVIRKDSEFLHVQAMLPALELLSDSRFAPANAELLAALHDYRRNAFGDCLTKCGSAFESVLKLICGFRGWPCKQTDTAAPLLRTVIVNASLEPFLEQPFILIATLRNRLSTAHGSGANARVASQAQAEYALNATAAAILYLIRETVQ